MTLNKTYVFYTGDKRYTGEIIHETDSHYIIWDTVKNKEYHLPKANTVVEVQ